MKGTFEKVYDTYYDSLYRYIFTCVKNKWNAEDIISTVFTKVYENEDKIEDVDSCKNWLFRIAHNQIIDFYRKNGKVILIDNYIDNGFEDEEFNRVLDRDELSSVKKIMDKLPNDTVNMINLRFYGGLKFKEIAEVVNKSENTVKTIVTRAIKKIKSDYEDCYGGDMNGR